MNAKAKAQPTTRASPRSGSAEQRLKELHIELPAPPEPFGTYAKAVQTGKLLFLTGMLPTEGGAAKFPVRVGAELDVETGRQRPIWLRSISLLSRGSIWARSTR